MEECIIKINLSLWANLNKEKHRGQLTTFGLMDHIIEDKWRITKPMIWKDSMLANNFSIWDKSSIINSMAKDNKKEAIINLLDNFRMGKEKKESLDGNNLVNKKYKAKTSYTNNFNMREILMKMEISMV